MKTMIVKVQIAIGGDPSIVLIYNQDRSIIFQYEAKPEDEVVALMGDRLKAYFCAHKQGTDIVLDDFAPEQEW